MAPEIVLDLSRLLSRVRRAVPTGVDRVELQYAQHLLDKVPERIAFGARFPYGVYGRVPRDAARQFLSHIAAVWRQGPDLDQASLRLSTARQLGRLVPRPVPAARRPRVFLQVSPRHLEHGERLDRILQREGGRFVCLIHDVIPMTHPEYARREGAELHRRRIANVMRTAAGVVVNSAATHTALLATSESRSAPPPICVAHLGTELPDLVAEPSAPGSPYFLSIGTIEPRKNHLLLLNVWRRLAETQPSRTPRLILVGARGWENEQVVDMLERSPALRGRVIEHNALSDKGLQALLPGARALLMPSFAEGFGMPVTEALAAGLPVIAADIPALREIGGDVPEFLDPLDGPAWLAAVLDYAELASPRRAAQRDRLAAWRPTTWSQHIDTVLAFVDSL